VLPARPVAVAGVRDVGSAPVITAHPRRGRNLPLLALCLSAGMLACLGAVASGSAASGTDAATLQRIDTALAGEQRSSENRARDVYRHPRQTLQFFGLRSDMSIIEITPGGGWYAEILAPVVKDHGHYAAAMAPPKSADAEDTQSLKALKALFARYPQRMGTLHTVPFGPAVTEMAPAGSVDMILTFRNLHNWIEGGWADKALSLMFKALKPGGILAIADHRGNPAVPQDPKAKSGYVNEDYAIKLIEAAGFRLAGRSEINANPRDTRDYKEGVWTLPPTLVLGEKDRDKYLKIGESDRYTLKFRKP